MMLRQGFLPSSYEWCDVAHALNRELRMKPWDPVVLDLEAYDIDPATLNSESWRAARSLYIQMSHRS